MQYKNTRMNHAYHAYMQSQNLLKSLTSSRSVQLPSYVLMTAFAIARYLFQNMCFFIIEIKHLIDITTIDMSISLPGRAHLDCP